MKNNTHIFNFPEILQIMAMTILDSRTCDTKHYPGELFPHEFCVETKTLGKSLCNVSNLHHISLFEYKVKDKKMKDEFL